MRRINARLAGFRDAKKCNGASKGCVVARSTHKHPDADMNAASDSGSDCSALCPLNLIRAGMAVRIKQLRAPDEMSARLREIGFCEEQIIKPIISQTNIICQVCNARLAISAQIAQMIFVEPVFQRMA
jgi:Fe2+ transport system protein FeoA